METMSLSDIDNSEPPILVAQPNKRRRKKSIVWDHFTVEKVESGCVKALCNQCKKAFSYITGTKLAGTSHLKRHISLGICPARRQRNQPLPSPAHGSEPRTGPTRKRQRSSPMNFSIDQNLANDSIVKMIILHDYPLNIMDQPGFISFIQNLQPQFNLPSFNAVQGDCVAVYLKEKESLLGLIKEIPGKVSLALDLWVSNQSLGYIFVTGQFVDADWNLHRRILNVVTVQSLDSTDSFNQAVATCLSDWHLEGRLFSLILDQSFLSETAFDNLRGFLPVKNQILLNGQLLMGNCLARVLSRLAQDAIAAVGDTVTKVRDNVKYVKTSESREERFIELKHHLQVPSTKDLLIDDQTRWDTTYHMLMAASEVREVFSCLDTSDPNYNIAPAIEEWNQVEALCSYLQHFFDAAYALTTPTCPTANIFFPELSTIQIELMQSAMSEDPFITYLTRPMYETFDKYWSNSCLSLAVAVVMDPRFKMTFVEFTFRKIYGDNFETWVRIVDDGIHELFIEYMNQMLALPGPLMEDGNVHMSVGGGVDGLSDFDIYISEISEPDMKSELDQYLVEPHEARDPEFDVLSWWNCGMNRSKYPTLSRMASDVLSMPVSTVDPNSVFDTDVKRMGSERASLHPVTIEALYCAKDWLQQGSLTQIPSQPPPSFEVSNGVLEMKIAG